VSRRSALAKVFPFHSTLATDPAVHHDNNACPLGQAIELESRRDGEGGRPRCERCEELNRTERF
jgi:hypothetical protein